MTRRGVLLLSAAALIGGMPLGCALRGQGNEAAERPQLEDPSTVEVIVGDDAYYRQPEQFDPSGLGLRAISMGPVVALSAHNRAPDQIAILRDDLAIITGPDPSRDLVRLNPGTAEVRNFTPLFLNQGERGALQFAMRDIPDLRGMRLVYNNPRQEIRFFIIIE